MRQVFRHSDVQTFGEEIEDRSWKEASVRRGASSLGAVSRPPTLGVTVGKRWWQMMLRTRVKRSSSVLCEKPQKAFYFIQTRCVETRESNVHSNPQFLSFQLLFSTYPPKIPPSSMGCIVLTLRPLIVVEHTGRRRRKE
ncbi:MAG: hypothetical protein RIE59_21540 [Imperialibacter sp.]